MDWNNDGLMDLTLGNYWGKIFLYTRHANGSLTEEPKLCFRDGGKQYEITGGKYFGTPQFVDWNEDGYLDLAVNGYNNGSTTGRVYLFMNTNDHSDSPVFTIAGVSRILNTKWRTGLEFADMNNDGAKDIVMGSSAYGVYYYENTGTNSNPKYKKGVTLRTVDGTLIKPGNGSRLREDVFDWNNDGILDLILGEQGDYQRGVSPIYVYLGTATAIGDEENAEIQNQLLEIQLLQNPVTNFAIPVDLISSTATQAVASIFDINGRLQSTEQLDLNAGTNQVILDASDIPPGICLVRVTSDSATASARVVLGY